MDSILHDLFARQAFTSSLVERNFGCLPLTDLCSLFTVKRKATGSL